MLTLPPRTKTEYALSVIRQMIAEGKLRQGQRIRIKEDLGELQISVTPIREALRLLQADGVVVYRPHLGIGVGDYYPVREVRRLRAVLEPLATELAMPHLAAKIDVLERLHRKFIDPADPS